VFQDTTATVTGGEVRRTRVTSATLYPGRVPGQSTSPEQILRDSRMPTSHQNTSLTRAVPGVVKDYLPGLLPSRYGAPHRFVILSTGRTGSELLVSLLDSHPDIRCAGELLRDGRTSPERFVAAQSVKAGLRGKKAFGWKLLLNHFWRPGGTIRGIGEPSSYPARLHALGYKIILLVRDNPVEQALSAIHGEQRQFHYRNGASAGFTPITVDPVHLMASTWILESDTRVMSEFVKDTPHLRLSYEESLLDATCHQRTVDAVCEYVGIRSSPVRSDLIKLTPRRLEDVVENIDQIHDLFARTRYAPFVGSRDA
jgi:hypothetical protein